MYDKNGGLPPGLVDNAGCEDPGFIGAVVKAGVSLPGVGFDALSAAAGVGVTTGRKYAGWDWGSLAFGTKWGLKAEVSGGVQIINIDPPKKRGSGCICSR